MVIGNIFKSLLSQDMTKQARQVEIIFIAASIIMLLTCWWLWQFKIELTVPAQAGREVIGKVNVFELLLMKR